MKNTSIKNTAARLDRFSKPDGWAQRVVEYGFAVYAECVVENNRAIFAAGRWDDDRDPLQDIVDFHHDEMAKDPFLSRAIIAGPVESEAIINGVRNGSEPSKGFLHSMTMNDGPFECGVGYRQENGELIPDHLAVLHPTAHIGRRPLKPLPLKPFLKLLAVVVGLLVLSGLAHHFSL